jgi:hypothetical protein
MRLTVRSLITIAIVAAAFLSSGERFAVADGTVNDAVRVRCSTGFTLNSGWTTIGWDIEDYKSVEGMHNNTTNNSRLVAPDTGVYLMTTFGLLTSNGGFFGTRAFRFELNGTTELAENSFIATAINIGVQSLSVVTKLNAGDYVEVGFFQDTGSEQTFDCTNATVKPHATLTYLTAG